MQDEQRWLQYEVIDCDRVEEDIGEGKRYDINRIVGDHPKQPVQDFNSVQQHTERLSSRHCVNELMSQGSGASSLEAGGEGFSGGARLPHLAV